MAPGDRSWLSPRRLLLLAALVLTVGASWWAEHGDQAVPATVEAVVRDAAQRSAASEDVSRDDADADAPLDLDRLTRREWTETDVNAFPAKSWYVPPPPPPPEPPPKPTAPPLPFQFMGKTEEVGSGKIVVYLAHHKEFHAVGVGDKFAGAYRLERIEPRALVIRYLPLSIDQSMPMLANDK